MLARFKYNTELVILKLRLHPT